MFFVINVNKYSVSMNHFLKQKDLFEFVIWIERLLVPSVFVINVDKASS